MTGREGLTSEDFLVCNPDAETDETELKESRDEIMAADLTTF